MTWNVNSVRVRLPHIKDLLVDISPDVLCLQEIKVKSELFPYKDFEDMGYHCSVLGQGGFNGVGIFSKVKPSFVSTGLEGMDHDQHSRWIEIDLPFSGKNIRVCCLYLPNGNPYPGEKYLYKKTWMDALSSYAKSMIDSEKLVIMAGDFNVIPSDNILDVWSTEYVDGDAVFLPEIRKIYNRMVNSGWIDARRDLYPFDEQYTFWDYMGGAWPNNKGIGIDHILLSPYAADFVKDSGICKFQRDKNKPSDHVPVWCELAP